jgi:hypothetical protein
MSVTPSPIGGFAAQFFDNNGVILSGGKIYTYAAGTTTPQATYTSASGTTPHANPIILDSAGRVPGGEIWLTDGLVYKFVIETATGILLGTYDNITGVNSNFVNYTVQEEVITATAGQTVFNLSTINYTPGTNSLSVYIDGVNQYVGDSYLETDSDTVTFTSGVHVGGEVKFTTAIQTTTGAVNADIVAYDPPFVGGVATNVETKLAQYISVKDFGAVGDGVADDTAAIQAALDATSTAGVSTTVYVPAGTYKTTATLDVPANASIVGAGIGSVLRPTGCDGLNFLASNAVAARRVSDLWIYADNGVGFKGINIDLDTPSGSRITGVTFDNLYISFFSTAIYARGVWASAFTNCYLHNVHTGIIFDGQSVKNSVLNCKIVRGSLAVTGSGDSRGVSVLQNGLVRPEDVILRDCLTFQFDVGAYVQTALFMVIAGCDFDFCQKKGIEIVQPDGGFTFRDSWIALDPASATATQVGVQFSNLGTARNSNAVISNNKINRGNVTGGDVGIRIGFKQNNVLIENNDVGAFDVGIYIDAADRAKIQSNTINGATSVLLAATDGVTIENNYFANAMTTTLSPTNTKYGYNSGAQTTWGVGEITIAAGNTSATVTLASLGLAPVVKGSPSFHKVALSWGNEGTLSRGDIWGDCDGTNITCRVDTAFGVPSGQTFMLQVY